MNGKYKIKKGNFAWKLPVKIKYDYLAVFLIIFKKLKFLR